MSGEVFSWPLRVYYEDTDVSGVVYHARYLQFLERARTEWLRARGLSQEVLRERHGVAFTVANMQIDFRRPARLDDELVATVAVTQFKRASLEFGQTLYRALAPDELLVRASVRIGCVDVKNFRPCMLPDLKL